MSTPGPEDALSTTDNKHDYSDLMRLESPHEVVVDDDGNHVLQDQKERINSGEPAVDGVNPAAPPPGGEPTAEPESESASAKSASGKSDKSSSRY